VRPVATMTASGMGSSSLRLGNHGEHSERVWRANRFSPA
jgi:hypothetical protein